MKFNSKVIPAGRLHLSKIILAMKLTAFIIVATLSTVSANTYSQMVTLHEKNIKIGEVLRLIEKQTSYHFLYDKRDISKAGVINVNVGNVSVEAALDKCFNGQPLTYKIFQSTIVIKSLEALKRENSLLNDIIVRGIVSDNRGVTLPGVSVKIKGTTTGSTTDMEGKYSITVPDGNSVLVFSYIGFSAQEVSVNGRTSIDIRLSEELTALSEVVIIGYGSVKKSDLTGSTSSISAAQIEKLPITTVGEALQGRSAGVQVVSSDGSPGAGINIKIRGTGTFGDNSPLYVVDGYPISGDLSQLNASDIASMDILKDASATAIYGSRASNGVVIITTKRGNVNMLQITVDARTSVQSQPQFYDLLNAEQFGLAAQEVNRTHNFPILPEWRNASTLRNIDWQDQLYQTGLRQNYNVALRGGNEKVQTSFSLGYLKQKGIVIFSDFARYNTSLNLDYVPAKWLKASTNVKYTRNDRQTRFGSSIGQVGNLTRAIPTMTGNPLTSEVKDSNGIYGFYTPGAQATTGNTNMIADLEDQDVHNPGNDLLTSGALEASFWDGFKFKTNIGVNIRNGSGYNFSKSNDRTVPPAQASYTQRANDTFEWLWENTLAYTKTFGIHSIDFVGGISSQENTFRQLNTTGNGLISNELRNIGSLTTITATGNQQTWSLASQFGRLSYKLTDKYILTGTIRRDGSSRFGPGKKWGVFPSVAAAWNVSKESFLEKSKFVDNLKIRGSWGKAGNQNIGLFQYDATYGTGSSVRDNRGYVFGAVKSYQQGLALNGLANANLTWESSIQSNIGIDATLLNNHINFTADYYVRESSDFLLDVPVPAQTGYTTATRNVGSIRNSGLELALEYRESLSDFKWAIAGNLSTVKNKILNFTDGVTAVGNFSNALGFQNYGGNIWTAYSQSRVGGNIGAFYGFRTDGIYQTKAEVDAANAGAKAKYGPTAFFQNTLTSPGDRRFVDVNGDGRITDADREIIGTPIPKMFGGLNFEGSYKQFDFSLFWYASLGNEIFNYAKRNLETFDRAAGVGLQNIGLEYYNNYWRVDRPSNEYTRLLAYDQVGNNRPSDAYVEDGSFIRLKNLQFGYNLPTSIANKFHSSKVRIFVSGQNLLTITKYSGLDPEIGDLGGVTGTGIDIGTYPTSRFYTMGLNVGF